MPERTSYQNTRQKWLSGIRTRREFLMALAVAAALGLRADAYAVERMTFKSAEAAATALSVACREHDEPRSLAILGPLGKESISSGDELAEKAALEMFAAAFELAHELVPARGGTQVLHVGLEDWPFPLPIVKTGDAWRFATVAGKTDLISRRIESNERFAINICWLYVALQAVYARKIRIPGQSAGVYAQKLRSDPGTHNGLDWEEETGGESSPAGRIFPLAAQEGYGPECGRQLPFHGYYLGVLTGQGKDAPGGEKNYIVSEKMTAGFAMVAYPAKYGSSGIKTFIVNHDGTVYQKDFGRQTERLADQMIKYNPDPSWSRVD